MNAWDELLSSQGWMLIEVELATKKQNLMERLKALAVESPDPAVRACATEIRAIEDLLMIPRNEAEGE